MKNQEKIFVIGHKKNGGGSSFTYEDEKFEAKVMLRTDEKSAV